MDQQPRRVTFADGLEMLVALRNQTRGATDPERAFVNFCLANINLSHARNLQDLWVAHETRGQRGGFFVEFGATDGVSASNSLMLEQQLGWRGILAEPARCWHAALRANRTGAIDERCVWVRSGERVRFSEAADPVYSGLAGFSEAPEAAAYEVETIALGELLTAHGAPRRIDYLSVDTEGPEPDILAAFDFAAWDVRLLTVEHNHVPERRERMRAIMDAQGYVRRLESLSAADDWYVKAG
jgi:FkbM family methyltransferase